MTIYSTKVCPKCAEIKKMCEEKNIPFENVDVTSDFKAKAKLMSKGIKTVPVVEIDGSMKFGDVDYLKSIILAQ